MRVTPKETGRRPGAAPQRARRMTVATGSMTPRYGPGRRSAYTEDLGKGLPSCSVRYRIEACSHRAEAGG